MTMSTLDLMHSLEQLPFAQAIAESTWLFPFFETVHVLALTLVVGSVAMMDLRLLGIGSRDRSITELTRSVLPWTWAAFATAATCGLLLFSSKAATYYVNIPFRIKIVCLLFAGVNMLVFHFVTARNVAAWDSGRTPSAARVAGVVSLLLWVVIVATGRWIGFTT
jgi:hypothetical protein